MQHALQRPQRLIPAAHRKYRGQPIPWRSLTHRLRQKLADAGIQQQRRGTPLVVTQHGLDIDLAGAQGIQGRRQLGYQLLLLLPGQRQRRFQIARRVQIIDVAHGEPGSAFRLGHQTRQPADKRALRQTRTQCTHDLQGQIQQRQLHRHWHSAKVQRVLETRQTTRERQHGQQQQNADHLYDALPERQSSRHSGQVRRDQRNRETRSDARTAHQQRGLIDR